MELTQYQALVMLIQDEACTETVRRKATLLLGEILQLANHTLPLQYAAQIQALPRLFTGVTDFSKPGDRNSALSALSSIDSLFRNNRKRGQAIGQPHGPMAYVILRWTSADVVELVTRCRSRFSVASAKSSR